MEYIYAAMLLHKAGKPVNEENVTKILQAADVKADPARVKALVAALAEIDIGEAIKAAQTFMPSAAAPIAPTAPAAQATAQAAEPKKEEKKEEKTEEEALEGLGALFG